MVPLLLLLRAALDIELGDKTPTGGDSLVVLLNAAGLRFGRRLQGEDWEDQDDEGAEQSRAVGHGRDQAPNEIWK